MVTTAMYSDEEYTDMITIYGETHYNAAEARRLYSQRFPTRRLPSVPVFRRTYIRSRTEGTFQVQRVMERPIRDASDIVQNLIEYFEAHPTHGQRRAAVALGVSRSSVQRILAEQNWHPCKHQQLYGNDFQNQDMAIGQDGSSACDAIAIKQEPDTTPEQHGSSAFEFITIKQEPVDAEPHASPQQELEYISVKEETPEWKEPDGLSSAQDPLNMVNEEWKEPDGLSRAQDPLNMVNEECLPSEDFLGPNTDSIDKTENEEHKGGEAVSKDDWEELKHEVQLTSSGSEQESNNLVGVEDDKCTGDSGSSVTKTSIATRPSNRMERATKTRLFCGNKTGTKHVVYTCGICKKMFAGLQELKEHTHVREEILHHSCNVCHKKFSAKSSLKVHSRVHTGERPYSCGVCNKTFTQSGNLKQHSLLHSDQRPHRCCICNKTFKQSGTLNKHFLLHNVKHQER